MKIQKETIPTIRNQSINNRKTTELQVIIIIIIFPKQTIRRITITATKIPLLQMKIVIGTTIGQTLMKVAFRVMILNSYQCKKRKKTIGAL